MTTTTTKHRYIVADRRILGGEPIIESTRTPVRAIAELWRLGLQPDEISRRLVERAVLWGVRLRAPRH